MSYVIFSIRQCCSMWLKRDWNQNNKKKKLKKQKQKNQRYCKLPLGQLQALWHLHHRDTKSTERAGNQYLFEKIMKENFPNLVKQIDMQVQEAQRVPNKVDLQRGLLQHIIIKMTNVKDKERILKVAKEKQLVIYRGVPIRLSADFSKELCRL